MRPTNLTRYTFDLAGETHKYSDLRKYVCDRCGGQPTHRVVWSKGKSFNDIACARCGGLDIISEWMHDKQVSDAEELRGSPLYQRHMEQVRKGSGMALKDVKKVSRLKRVEVIRLGWTEPTQSGYDRPVAADHFVLSDAPTLAKIFEGEDPPKSLQIYFPYRTFDENVEASYGVWVGGRKDQDGRSKGGFRVCQGDGESVQSALPFKTTTKKNGTVSVTRASGDRLVSWGKAARDFTWDKHTFQEGDIVPCPGRARGLYTHCDACNTNILIKVRIRDPRVARFGYWQISTQSVNNYLHFMSVWDELTDEGRVPLPMSEVPFVISIEPGATLFQNQRDQMWGTREAYFLKLELDPEIAQLEQAHRERRIVALLSGRSFDEPMSLLPADLEDVEEIPFDETPNYDTEYLDDDPFQMQDGDFSGAPMDEEAYAEYKDIQAEEARAAEHVPAPEDLTHKNIVEHAVALNGYESVGEVKSALLAIIGKGWQRSTEWSPRDVWVQLQDHIAAPSEGE